MISINNISKKYGSTEVLHIESIMIAKGQTFGLVGNNGAGKTTLFNCILDLIKPTSGSIKINNIEVNKDEKWKKITGSFIDESFLIGHLTPDEYFEFIGEIRGMNKTDINLFLKNYKDFFNNEILGNKKYLRDLSKGNQKKVGIIASLMGNPKVVILDEPFANLDPSTQIRLKQIINNLTTNKDVTVLISSHDLSHITDVCDRIALLDKGTLIKDIKTSPATLKELENYFSNVTSE